ncbi:MAG TPA: glutamyl-tRNA reductase, partial [Acidimicrobiales bacterium]|nr:glutamyl-tRNA reductase [Acidimicrobiales bacterium]
MREHQRRRASAASVRGIEGGGVVPVVVVGLHERDCTLDLLERITVSEEEEHEKCLALLLDSPEISEAVILSTCMRTEVYAVLDRFHEGVADLTHFFASRLAGGGSTTIELEDVLRVEYDDAAVRHLFNVAAGIDSAVLGEGEILRQVRTASERARDQRAAGPILGVMFRHALEVGKRARTETAISKGTLSLAHVAVELAISATGGPLAERRVVVAGAGEMGAGIALALESAGASEGVVIVNRTRSAADAVAERIGARTAPLGDFHEELAVADVIISATGAGSPVITAAAVSQALANRPGRGLVIVDAAVPRDVEPEVATLDGVQLFDVDALRLRAEAQMSVRRAEVWNVERIVDEELERYRHLQRSRSAAPIVSSLH